MEARAIAKGLRVSPIRARLTIDMIRGKSVQEAANILINTTNKSARLIKKVLDSAIANAVNNNNADAASRCCYTLCKRSKSRCWSCYETSLF